MTTMTNHSNPAWRRLRFLLTPEDSSAAGPGLPPPLATPWCCRAKAIVWLAAGVAAALALGQL